MPYSSHILRLLNLRKFHELALRQALPIVITRIRRMTTQTRSRGSDSHHREIFRPSWFSFLWELVPWLWEWIRCSIGVQSLPGTWSLHGCCMGVTWLLRCYNGYYAVAVTWLWNFTLMITCWLRGNDLCNYRVTATSRQRDHHMSVWLCRGRYSVVTWFISDWPYVTFNKSTDNTTIIWRLCCRYVIDASLICNGGMACDPPILEETRRALNQLNSGKYHRGCGIYAEMLRAGGAALL